jgi:hypothetical protein
MRYMFYVFDEEKEMSSADLPQDYIPLSMKAYQELVVVL